MGDRGLTAGTGRAISPPHMKLATIDTTTLATVSGGSFSYSVKASTTDSNQMVFFMMAAMLMRPQNLSIKYTARY